MKRNTCFSLSKSKGAYNIDPEQKSAQGSRAPQVRDEIAKSAGVGKGTVEIFNYIEAYDWGFYKNLISRRNLPPFTRATLTFALEKRYSRRYGNRHCKENPRMLSHGSEVGRDTSKEALRKASKASEMSNDSCAKCKFIDKHANEEDIKHFGCYCPIITWQGCIIDGHHRYEICNRYRLSFRVEEREFEDKIAVKISRRNLPIEERLRLAFADTDLETLQAEAQERMLTGKQPDPRSPVT